MVKKTRIDEFTEDCKKLPSDMRLNYRNVSPSFEFSNTGRRGIKYFTITLVELLATLKDIKANIVRYEAAKYYVESTMRDLFSDTVSTGTVNALSTVQTLPLFSLINKVIYVANDLDTAFNEKYMNIDAGLIDNTILYIESQMPDNDSYLESISTENPEPQGVGENVIQYDAQEVGENVIYYGAPGVGKSYKIDKVCTPDNSIRTVFHPDSQYSDFTGCLKPTMSDDKVIYEFRPGPFTLALIKASLAPEKMTYLVIEEINRASAAAVFGELFQLLDRSPSGESSYEVTLSDPDMIAYLKDKSLGVLNGNNIRLPSNLSLYATMNSSDQAVMPMDTAFKRRWKFEYIPIDYSECPAGEIKVPVAENQVLIATWKQFAESVNEILEIEDIPEDRLLGPWFLNESELKTPQSSHNALKGKLLLYLWDDVLRHGDKNLLFADGITTYGRLMKRLKSGETIFSEQLEKSISEKVSQVAEELIGENPDGDDSDQPVVEES